MKQKFFTLEVIGDDQDDRTFILRELVNPQLPPVVCECCDSSSVIADYLDSADLFSQKANV